MPVTSTRSLPADARRSLRIYNTFFPLAFVGLLPGLMSRMLRRGGYRENFGQRFGIFSPELRARFAKGRWIWIHSISVGETLLALKLVRELQRAKPDLHIALSVTTSTGFAQAAAAAGERLVPIYNPLDSPPFVRRALDAVRPERLVFIEAMWPNLLAAASQAGIRVAMVPRLSPRSASRFRRFKALTGPLFRLIDRFYVQDASDRERWADLGVDPARIEITGNAKFDLPAGHAPALDPLLAVLDQCGIERHRPILLAGSTFPGEELILGRVFTRLRARFPDLFLIVVPRHFERSADAEKDLKSAGLQVARRTHPTSTNPDCLLVDTTGELRDWYHLAMVVFIGKSLTSHGGQNPTEAVMAGKPVIYGPHMENFRAVVDAWRDEEAAIQVADEQALEAAAAELLASPERRKTLALRARSFLAEHLGATEKIVQRILQL